MKKLPKQLQYLFIILTSLVILYACANIALPTGGDYDETPPKVLKATPDFNSLNVGSNKIEILFDENIKVEKANEKVIITPPQLNQPAIKSLGKRVVVELNDSLQRNTTYTIDFTDAIVDYNEGNPLENFSISFSTGEILDTLSVSGKVLAAENLEPVSGIYIGMHSNLSDTAFTTIPFERISRTNSRGAFTVKSLAPGKYKIFALNDLNRDYKYDNPLEDIAFLDSIIVPTTIITTVPDTIFTDSLTIDTIKSKTSTHFLPDDVLLRTFKSDFKRHYFQKSERKTRSQLTFYFASPTELAHFTLLEPKISNPDWYLMEKSAHNDTISLWLMDSLVILHDSIKIKLDYLNTDVETNINSWKSDTIDLTYRDSRKGRKEKENTDKFLSIKHNMRQNFEVYDPINVEFEYPVDKFEKSQASLFQLVDSVYQPINYQLQADTLNPRKFLLKHKWDPGGRYRLAIDSSAVMSYNNLWNDKLQQDFSVKSLDQYGNIMFLVSGIPPNKTAYVELLDKSDKPFRKKMVNNGEALFFDINPGIIYARLFIDDNEDGLWTTGDYHSGRQPEEVYYYPRGYEIRAYTDHEEEWDLLATPVSEQKPLEITKNKPQVRKKRNLREEMEREKEQRQRQGVSMPIQTGRSGSTVQDVGGRR